MEYVGFEIEDRFVVGATLFPEGETTPLTIAEASAVADGPGWWMRFAAAPASLAEATTSVSSRMT